MSTVPEVSAADSPSPEAPSLPPLLTDAEVRSFIKREIDLEEYRDQRVLLIVPDATRTAPLPLLFDALFEHLRPVVADLNVIVALGTHPPMSEAAICKLLGISERERGRLFAQTQFFNHEWDNREALVEVGRLSQADVETITEGRLSLEVPVEINRQALEHDRLLVVGPVFPHEVVGFSGGNKYFFPGIGGPPLLNFFHWLGALITNVGIIGNERTPVRDVVDRAAALIPTPRRALTFVVATGGRTDLHGLFYGSPEDAWQQATVVSRDVHIKAMPRAYPLVISCVPEMYDELWVAGKGMYKLEPVVADDGELIIYAPHLDEVSLVHGRILGEIGYHCRDYFVKQWDRFKDYPWGTLAHSTHVRGQGVFENGEERCRIRVTLASQIPEETCLALNLGYRDPTTLDPASYEGRDDVLVVQKAGEQLYRLADSVNSVAATS